MLELGRQEDLAPEPLHREAGQQLGGEHLDDNTPAERFLDGNVGAGHAPAAQLPLEAVAAGKGLFETAAQVVQDGLRGEELDTADRSTGRTGRTNDEADWSPPSFSLLASSFSLVVRTGRDSTRSPRSGRRGPRPRSGRRLTLEHQAYAST
jgi:hypothetical protein